MTFLTKTLSTIFKLSDATNPKLKIEKDIRIPMSDGLSLRADRISPGDEPMPCILIRTPYTHRRDWSVMLYARIFAERGYHVVAQNCRGTWDSDGEWNPFLADRDDGIDTLKWISEQPWFDGTIGMFGISYWGYAQLATGADAPDYLKALVPQMAASSLFNINRNHGILSFHLALSWNYTTYISQKKKRLIAQVISYLRGKKAILKGFSHLPISESDRVVLGFTSRYYQDILVEKNPNSRFWTSRDHAEKVYRINAAVHFIAGWYDIFLDDELADYAALRAVEKNPYLTIGPWTHTGSIVQGAKESLIWYDAHLKGNKSSLREKPVRIFLMGKDEWLDFDAFPPPSVRKELFFTAGGKLADGVDDDSVMPSRYTYDPSEPTPAVGGATVTRISGAKNNIRLESRPDVLTFTSEPMEEDMTIIGLVRAKLFARAKNPNTDFFVRLCDVTPKGKKSTNICDGIVRIISGKPWVMGDNKKTVREASEAIAEAVITENEGVMELDIELTNTAYCFKTGHRIRVQVSSGAHPLFVRNLGVSEPQEAATEMRISEQEIFHDSGHPSSVTLPLSFPIIY